MERKAIHALLLSLAVITGAVTITTDAYAQTNTDRLITVVENTNNASSMLDMILAAINDGVESILAAIGSLATSVDDGLAAIDADLMAVDSDLQAIHGDLEDVHGDLTAIDSDLQAIHGDLEDVHGDLSHIDADLVTIHDDLESVHGDLTDMDADIESLTQSVNTLGQGSAAIAELASAVTTTQESTTANSAAINEIKTLIMQVSDSLGVVQNQTAPADPDEAPSAVGTTLSADDEDFSVLVSAFGLNKATSSTFKTSLTFSCEADVFVGKVMTDDRTLAVRSTADNESTADTAPARVLITANNIPVYDTRFSTGNAGAVVYKGGANLNLMPLSAGSSVTIDISTTYITTDLKPSADADNRTFTLTDYVKASNRGLAINGEDDGDNELTGDVTPMTKQEAGKLEVLKVPINWYTSAADAGCMLKSPTSPAVDYSETDEVVSSTLVAKSGETGAIQAIDDKTFTCDAETAVTKVALEGIPIGFLSFIDLDITADKTKSLKFMNDTNVPTAVLDEPLEFTGGDFTISGKIPGTAALISVTYDTVKDSTCSAN